MVLAMGELWGEGGFGERVGTYSANVCRAGGVSVCVWVSDSSTSSPGASGWALVSPISRTSPLSLPCMSMSMESSAFPVAMRTSGSAMMGGSIGLSPLGDYVKEIIWGCVGCFEREELCNYFKELKSNWTVYEPD